MRTKAGQQLTEAILEVFRLNGELIRAGNSMTGEFGLTSARWQVMGAIDNEGRSLTVSDIARLMGQSRQSIQRLANELEREGFLCFEEKSHDARSKLVALTNKGVETMSSINRVQADWVNSLAKRLSAYDIRETCGLLRELRVLLSETS